MTKKEVKADSFEERLRVLVTDEVSAAIEAGDEDRAYKVVTTLASLMAQAIAMASLCDEDFVEDAMSATAQILEDEIGRTAGKFWPIMFISSTREAS